MNLRPRFLWLTVLFFVVVAAPSWLMVRGMAESILQKWAVRYAEKQVQYDKSRMLLPVLREVALSKQLANSPILRGFAHNPDEAKYAKPAIVEMESYRQNFLDKSYFVALRKNLRYFHNNARNEFAGQEFRYVLDDKAPKDAWFFDLIRQQRDLHINVNPDVDLGITKLWIDVLIRDGDDILGIVGTGIDLAAFIQDLTEEEIPGVTSLFVDHAGAIQIYRNQALIDFGSVSKAPSQQNTIRLLLERDVDYQAVSAAMRSLEQSDKAVTTLFVNYNGKRHLAGVAYLPEIDWYEITLLDIDKLLPFSEFTGVLIVYGLSLLGLLLLFNLTIRRYVLTPLKKLDHAILAVESGRPWPQELAQTGAGEINQLMRRFAKMAQSVTDARADLEAKVQERTAALDLLAKNDYLTGLPNRLMLEDRLQLAMSQSRRLGRGLAVAYLDLDGFKAVNDEHGHDCGDQLLVALTERMKTALREGDTLARIGGDEFVAVLVNFDQSKDCEMVMSRLLMAAAEPVMLGGHLLQVSASIGVTLYPQDNVSADLLLVHADQAMYMAKQAGKNRYQIHEVTLE